MNFGPSLDHHAQPLISYQGGCFGCAAEISKLWQLTLFILTRLFGFGDSVAPAVKEIALLPAGSETEKMVLKTRTKQT